MRMRIYAFSRQKRGFFEENAPPEGQFWPFSGGKCSFLGAVFGTPRKKIPIVFCLVKKVKILSGTVSKKNHSA